MPPRGHAILSPSSAERFINCPPSALLNADAERADTVYSLEGTLAHELAEIKARAEFDAFVIDPAQEYAIRSNELYSEEMERHTDRYVECLKEISEEFSGPPTIKFESKLDVTEWIPDGFGTADCIMIGLEDIHVIDFKYGKGVVVEAERNPQMMIYALGAIAAYGDFLDLKTVHMTIIQPRIRHDPSTFSMPIDELMEWANNVLKPAAELAIKGEGEFKMGDWCRFCCNNGKCRQQLKEFEDVPITKEASCLSEQELTRALELAPLLDKWFDALKGFALESCLDGNEVEGWKAVEGRSNRSWKDQKAAFQKAVSSGYPEEMLYERKPLTVAQLESQMGKKAFKELMSDQVVREPGKPTLAKATDKRDAIVRAKSIEEDFK